MLFPLHLAPVISIPAFDTYERVSDVSAAFALLSDIPVYAEPRPEGLALKTPLALLSLLAWWQRVGDVLTFFLRNR